MKTINGNNKLERQINKALKYVDLELKQISNNNLKIVKFSNKNFLIAKESYKVLDTKFGRKILIEPLNSDKKYWINDYNTILLNEYYHKGAIVIRVNDNQLNDFNELANGCDDIYRLDIFKELFIKVA